MVICLFIRVCLSSTDAISSFQKTYEPSESIQTNELERSHVIVKSKPQQPQPQAASLQKKKKRCKKAIWRNKLRMRKYSLFHTKNAAYMSLKTESGFDSNLSKLSERHWIWSWPGRRSLPPNVSESSSAWSAYLQANRQRIILLAVLQYGKAEY